MMVGHFNAWFIQFSCTGDESLSHNPLLQFAGDQTGGTDDNADDTTVAIAVAVPVAVAAVALIAGIAMYIMKRRKQRATSIKPLPSPSKAISYIPTTVEQAFAAQKSDSVPAPHLSEAKPITPPDVTLTGICVKPASSSTVITNTSTKHFPSGAALSYPHRLPNGPGAAIPPVDAHP
jgi:hypothetical protein